jgi:hypothetical protein
MYKRSEHIGANGCIAHPENSVRYTYGNKNASHNRVRRLMLQEDGSGAQEFTYDRMGNIQSVRRTVIIPNQAVAT